MRNRGTLIIVLTLLACGCPGVWMFFYGGFAAVGIDDLSRFVAGRPLSAGETVVYLCFGAAFLLLTLGVVFYNLRPREKIEPKDLDAPLPPAI
jgi:hypothetical protein